MLKYTYTAKDLGNALAEAREGSSMCSVAQKLVIPLTTLHDHLLGKSSKVGAGGATVKTIYEDRENFVYGATREVVGGIVRDYLLENAEQNPFMDGSLEKIGYRGS